MRDIERERAFRQACGTFATGITVILTERDGTVHGMTANAFMSVSLDPMLIAVSINRQSRMHGYLEPDAARFSVSVLNAGQRAVSDVFSRHRGDPPVLVRPAPERVPVIPGSLAWFVCEKDTAVEAGDHTIIIGKVLAFAADEPADPLIFYRGGYYTRVESDDCDFALWLLER